MCGIAGQIDNGTFTADERRAVLSRMCGVIEHRGPDDEGFYIDGGAALGMRRLAIIDLNTGHQPISNEDGTVWIVFNGEIYNYRELRAEMILLGHSFRTLSDTEVIVHLYEQYGESCVTRLRGMFAFAIWDRRKRSLFAAPDRVGIKPFHYAQTPAAFIFGSEIKSVLQHPAVDRSVDPQAVSDFLSFGYVPDPKTTFAGINKLEPGHTLTLTDSAISIRRYWDFNYDQSSQVRRSEREYVERLRELLSESVRLRLLSDVPLGAFLSGGVDSSTVVAMMAREMGQPVKTFSIGFKESSCDELGQARIVARHLNTDHHEFVVTPNVCELVREIVWHHDEPFADVSSVPTYIVSKMASEHVTVVLSGDGGDEVFGGYDRYLVDIARRKYERIPAAVRRNVFARAGRMLPRGAYGKNFLSNIALDSPDRYIDSLSYFNQPKKQDLLSADFKSLVEGYDAEDRFKDLFMQPNMADSLDRMMYLDSKTYLAGDILTKVDRMSMAHSLEARVPLLDHQLIEFAQTIPAELKVRGRVQKHIFKEVARGMIPDAIIERPKQGFDVPIKNWLNNELRVMFDEVIGDPRTRQRGYFDQEAVGKFIAEHRRERR